MRFNIINLFPDMSISGAGGNNTNPVKSSGENEQKKKPVTVNIFSTFDADQSQNVDYNEAKSNSIFVPVNDFESMRPVQDNYVGQNTWRRDSVNIDSSALAEIRQKAFAKYNPVNKFNEMLQNFSSKTGVEQKTFDDGIEDSQEISAVRMQMDQKASSEAHEQSFRANVDAAAMYQEALNAAMQEYNEEHAQENAPVYSSYDSDQNNTVTGAEAKQNGLLKFDSDSLQDMKPSTMSGDDIALNIVREKAISTLGFSPSQEFENKIAEFNETYESQTTQNGGVLDSQSFKDMQQDIDTQIKSKADSFSSEINSSIKAQYQAALDNAYANLELSDNDIARMQMENDRRIAGLNLPPMQNGNAFSPSSGLSGGVGVANQPDDINSSYNVATVDEDMSVKKFAKSQNVKTSEVIELNDDKNLKRFSLLKKGEKIKIPKYSNKPLL